MKSYFRSFNTYFATALLCLVMGCKTAEQKQQTTMRLFIEGPKADLAAGAVLVTPQKIPISIERAPFLTEAELSSAALVDDPTGDGTFMIKLAFSEHGSLVLDMTTASNKGRHIVIYSQFPDPEAKHKKEKKKKDSDDDLVAPPPLPAATQTPGQPRESAFLAAVLIHDRDTSGVIQFTPDVTRKEALRIVRGLRNVIAAAKKKNRGM